MSLELVSNISSTLSGIEAEVSILRDVSNNKIGSREVARSFINNHLTEMPEIVTGEHLVSFKDDREEWQVKPQLKNLSLWTVALQTTIETGHTSYQLLGSILSEWATTALDVTWPRETADKVAQLYVMSMQQQGILATKLATVEFIDDETKERRESRVAKLDECFTDMMAKEVEALREASKMVCKPLRNQPIDWVDAVTGIGEQANIPLITSKSYKGNEIAQPVISAVNKLQAVKFTVSPVIINAAYDILDNQHEFNSTDEELRMYREMVTLENAVVHFAVTMDTRGRMYYRGGLLTPQGTDFCKAAFQFANSKRLGVDGYKAILLHTATVLGMGKLSITKRVQWVIDNRAKLALIEDHYNVAEFYPSADIHQATVAIKELQSIWLFDGEIEDYESTLVCHQDGTCNGLQHMAAITKNRQTAITVNCVASTHDDEPSDIYAIISNFAFDTTTDDIQSLILKYGRDMSKNPVMITGYGAGEETIKKNIGNYLVKYNEDASKADKIGEAYIAAISANAGAVKSLTGALKGRVSKAVEDGATRFQWTTADGFIASTEYRDIEPNRIRAGVFNALVKNMHPTELDDVKTIGSMAPNFIHSIDSTHLRMTVNGCNHDLVTVHDSIGSHAATYFDTARVIREQFVEVHQYDALGNLCESMEMRTPKFRGDYKVEEALESSYIFS